jgi:excinuclease ABC subunit A
MHVAAASDWVIDMGPGAGDLGGKIVVCGTPDEVAASKTGKTGPYLAAALREMRGEAVVDLGAVKT